MIAAILVWAGSHFFGVGEIVDVILIGVGVVGLGRLSCEGKLARSRKGTAYDL